MLYKEWDSAVLGVPTYELESIQEAPLANEYTVAKLGYDINAINYLERFGFTLCDVSVDYFLDLTKSSAYEVYGIRPFDKFYADRVLDITKNSFYLSRFHKDQYLSTEQADNLYQEWVINACNGNYGDAVFVAVGGKDIVGFSICRLDGKVGHIDLTALDIANKDPNASSSLIAADINFFHANLVNYVRTSTQIENYPSRASLERLGFKELGFTVTMSKGRRNG